MSKIDRRLGAIMAGYGLKLREDQVYYRFWIEDKLAQIRDDALRAQVQEAVQPFLDKAVGSDALRQWMNRNNVHLPHGKLPYWQRFKIACFTAAKAEQLLAGGDPLGKEVQQLGAMWRRFCTHNEKGESLEPGENWFEVCSIAGITPVTGYHFSSLEEAENTLRVLQSFPWPTAMLRTISDWIRTTNAAIHRLQVPEDGAPTFRRGR